MSTDGMLMKHSPSHSDEEEKNSLDEDYEADESYKSDSYFGSDNELELGLSIEGNEYSGEEEGEDEEEDEDEEETPERVNVNDDVYNFDFDTVEDVTNILYQIKLIWPEDLPAYDREVNKHRHTNEGFPSNYYEFSDKEKVVLWHAENFRQQFAYLYPKRRPLYLAPRNDCGVHKLFPTYIKPTLLGYPEFYEYDRIMDFLKDYLAPELFDPPDLLPSTVRAPLTNLKVRDANAFEFCLVAASFLVGAGYDAYVVDGYAKERITTVQIVGNYIEEDEIDSDNKGKAAIQQSTQKEEADKAKEDESFDMDIFREEEVIRPVSPSKYRIRDKPPVTSNYLAAMQKRVDDKLAEELRLAEIEAEKERSKRPATPDPFEGCRVHAWILILPGKREITEPFFMEPFSGARKEIADPALLGIEAVFNHENYYVNQQDCRDGNDKLSFDLKDKTKWSMLLYEAPKKNTGGNPLGQESFQDEGEDDTGEYIEMFLDMPVSWVKELEITLEGIGPCGNSFKIIKYDLKYPDGRKTYQYDDAILEIASPLVNPDGMVKKVIKFAFKTRDPKQVVYIEEWFMNRKYRLNRRKWLREGRMIHEYFSKGRPDALKEHVHVSGRNNPDQPRHLYFYSDAHHQNVSHREVVPRGIIEHFDNREDKLYYRMTKFGKILCFTIPPQDIRESGVRALLEIMATDDTGGAKNRTRRKILKIHEKFHRDPSIDYKDDISEKHMLLEEQVLKVMFHYGEGCITRNTIDFLKSEEDEYNIKESIEYRIYTIVKQRIQEDWNHEIEPDEFSKNAIKRSIDEQEQVDKYSKDITGIDFVTPYIEKHGLPKNQTEELVMKKRIIYHMRNRIIKQAQMMESEFNHESSRLKTKLDWYRSIKNQLSPTEEEIYNNYYNEALFRMHIIQKRLVRHIHRAPTAYYNLLHKILNHPKLNNFTKQKMIPPVPETQPETEFDLKRKAKAEEKKMDCCQFFKFKFKEAAAAHQPFKSAQPDFAEHKSPFS